MSCEKLYLTAPEMLECTARVVSCTPNKNDGYDLETDRTPFFPEGGGQLSDIGTVYDPMQGFVPVTHCFEANGTVLHRTGKPFAVGEIVTLKVDAAKRLKYTQQHTGEHLLSHAYDVLFGAENVGFHMAGDVVTIDLDHDLSDEEIEAGEKYANELVWKNAPVRIFNVDASELPNLPLRKKNEKLHGEVRIVEVEDGDHTEMCTCCGTHFMSTAPVGLIKILEHARYKSGCRITFACGVLALEHFTKENAEVVEVGGYNLPANVAHSLDDVEGLYVTADLAAGDYILTSKVSSVPISSDVALNDIPSGKVAISLTVKTLASGLSVGVGVLACKICARIWRD